APLYEPVEFGVAQRSMEKAVSDVYGIDPAEVRTRDAAAGDLGLVAAELAAAAPAAASPSVHDVFTQLRSLANVSGAGSAERKLSIVRELLRGLDPISAKHLVRIPLGNSRLGVGDATI